MSAPRSGWSLGRRPALDGLRGLAVVLVVCAHAHLPGLATAGPVGVTVFFTLSGFLISALLLGEHERTGGIRLRAFYLRRALRLFPALAVCIAAVAVVGTAVPGFVTPLDVAAASTHLSNWVMVAAPSHYIGALSHTWSLATEEQFYLLWPLLLAAVLPRLGERTVLALAVVGSAMAAAERLWLWRGGLGQWRIYFGADTHADALLVGCALAVLLRRHGSRARPLVPAVLLPGLCVLSLTTGFTAGVVVPTLVPVMTAACISTVIDGPSPLTWRPLVHVGQRSYGLYLWHYPVAILVELSFGGGWLPQLALMVPTAACLTVVSWAFVERPFLRFKDRVPPSTGPTRGTVPTAEPLATAAA